MEIIESNHPKAGSLQRAVQEGAQTDPEYKETQLSGSQLQRSITLIVLPLCLERPLFQLLPLSLFLLLPRTPLTRLSYIE